MQEFIDSLEEYANKKKVKLTSDEKLKQELIDLIFEKEKQLGYKFCPMRVLKGDIKHDVEFLCPCDFEKQKIWEEKGRCWCGLFTKK